MADDQIPRRQFLKGAGAAGTAVAAVLSPGAVNRSGSAKPPAPTAAAAAAAPNARTLARR